MAAPSSTSATPSSPGTRRDLAVSAAVRQGLLTDAEPIVALLDVQGVRESAAALRSAFDKVTAPGQPVLHAFAVKAASLVPVLRLLDAEGLGCEVASPGELALAETAGVGPERIVLDSPAKTTAELEQALERGIALNVDNPEELARLDTLLPRRPETAARLGLRVNPQLGGGSIAAMSTATATSKFGVSLRDDGARDWVLRAFADRPWLSRLHCHVGSQGVPLELMAAGVRATYELAEEINAAAGRQQVDTIDLGGGLPVAFDRDEITPTFGAYARLLRETVPGLFDGRYGLVTEFGRALLARWGVVLARVEYAKSAGGRPIAVTHAGAQVAVRTVFAPESWPVRVRAYDPQGRPKDGEPVHQDVAGPCCFAGDLVARNRPLPPLEAGDLVGVLDTGAYYFSTPFSYNSLPRPAVHGYRVRGEAGGARAEGAGRDTEADPVRFVTVREAQTLAEVVAESGGDRRDALTGPALD